MILEGLIGWVVSWVNYFLCFNGGSFDKEIFSFPCVNAVKLLNALFTATLSKVPAVELVAFSIW